jgi:uncharacterized protein YndB with AHSA1/START domain
MKKLTFKIEINATVEHVFDTMVDPIHLLEWMSVFSTDSSFEGKWEKGESVIFKCFNEKGELCGLVCRIEEFIPNELIYIQPYGTLENGILFDKGEKVLGLDSTYEKYIFNQRENTTELIIEASAMDDYVQFFNETWPIALLKIKDICENTSS